MEAFVRAERVLSNCFTNQHDDNWLVVYLKDLYAVNFAAHQKLGMSTFELVEENSTFVEGYRHLGSSRC